VFVTIIKHNGNQITINLDQVSCITSRDKEVYFYFGENQDDCTTIITKSNDSALDFINELMKCSERHTIFDLRTP